MTGRETHTSRGRGLGRAVVLLTCVTMLVVGTAAAAFADWSPPENVAAPGQQILGASQIGYDATGRAYAMYVQYSPSLNDHLYLRERPPGGPWGAPQTVPTSGPIRGMSMAVNNGGDIVVAMGNATTVLRRPAGGSWSAPTTWNSPGTAGPTSGCALPPTVALGNNGNAVVSWPVFTSCNGNVTRWRIMAAAFTPANGWDATPQEWGVSPQNENSNPSVAVDDDGSITVAWAVKAAPGQDELWTAERDSVWHAPVQRSTVGSGQMQGSYLGIASRNGTTIIAWYRGLSTFAIEKSGGVWGSAMGFSGTAQALNDYGPAVAVDAAGNAYVARTVLESGNYVVRLSTLAPGGNPTSDNLLSEPGVFSGQAALSANANGDVAAVWDEVVNGNQFFAVGSLKPVGQLWPDTPTQLTTIPSDNTTEPRIAVDAYGHALAAATPITSGFGTSVQVMIELRDPATAPTTTPPSLSPTVVQAGNTLTCDAGVFHGTPPFTYNYVWLFDSAVVSGANGTQYNVQPTDAGHGIACRVTANNEAGSATADSAEVVVSYTPPGTLTPPTITGTIEAGQIIGCDPGTWSGAPSPDLTYQWLRNNVAIPFETTNSYYVDVTDGATQLVCRVTATNGGGTLSRNSAAANVPAVTPPKNTVKPLLGGPNPAALGDTLTCSNGTWTGAPTPVIAYEWLRSGVTIPFEYGGTYVVQPADAGATISCRVTGFNVKADVSVIATGTRAIQGVPVNTRLPSVGAASGSKWSVGFPATCANGGWLNALTFTYQWLRDGLPISGATTQTRTLTGADAGTTLSCIVTATGRGGTTSATGTGKALVGPPAPVTNPAVTGTPRPTRLLRCQRGTWTNASTFAISWVRQGNVVSTAATYTVVVGDIGQTIQCRVTATGPGGTTAFDSPGVIIQP